jgi:hypothetical protein
MKFLSALAIQVFAIVLRETSKSCGAPIDTAEVLCNCTQDPPQPVVDSSFLLLAVGVSGLISGSLLTGLAIYLNSAGKVRDGHDRGRRRGGGVLEFPSPR